jgi:hypothetical protein
MCMLLRASLGRRLVCGSSYISRSRQLNLSQPSAASNYSFFGLFLNSTLPSFKLLPANNTSIMYISSALILLFAGGSLVAGHGAIVRAVGDQGGIGTALGSRSPEDGTHYTY